MERRRGRSKALFGRRMLVRVIGRAQTRGWATWRSRGVLVCFWAIYAHRINPHQDADNGLVELRSKATPRICTGQRGLNPAR